MKIHVFKFGSSFIKYHFVDVAEVADLEEKRLSGQIGLPISEPVHYENCQ